jgi:chromate reductase
LRQVLYSTGSLVLPAPALFVANAKRLFDESGKLVDASLRERLSALLTGLGAWIDRVGG